MKSDSDSIRTNPQNTINIYPLLGNEKQTNDFQTSILRHFK